MDAIFFSVAVDPLRKRVHHFFVTRGVRFQPLRVSECEHTGLLDIPEEIVLFFHNAKQLANEFVAARRNRRRIPQPVNRF